MKKTQFEIKEGVFPSIGLEKTTGQQTVGTEPIREFFGFKETWDTELDGFSKSVIHTLRVGLALFFTFKLFEIAIALLK